MINCQFPRSGKRRASALIITLTVMVLIVVLIVGLLSIARIERVSAASHFEGRRAELLAWMATDNAVALLEEGISNGEVPGKLWSSQPGKITVFRNVDGSVDADASRLLFSTNTTGDLVNLNQAGFSGIAPLASALSQGASDAPPMEVNWINILENPSAPAGPTNRLTGRYAFWVDDESTRLDLNTADGNNKANGGLYGQGNPTSVSLSAFQASGEPLSGDGVNTIAQRSGVRPATTTATPRPFNTIRESLVDATVPEAFLEDNNFNLTHYNRSPDLNFFGEPKIHLLVTTPDGKNAMLGGNANDGSNVNYSGTSLLGGPLDSLYPLSQQLPKFSAPGFSPVSLPQVFQGTGTGLVSGGDNRFTTSSPGYPLGLRIARYLKGFNSAGTALQWPKFEGADATGFAGKYTDRQIDSIALQILTLLEKGVFADQFRGYALPYIMANGFLSGKPVKGLSYGPRVNEILIEINTKFGTDPSTGASDLPLFNMKIYIEWYLPKEFGGQIPSSKVSTWQYGIPPGSSFGNDLNANDAPWQSNTRRAIGPSALGGYWMDNMITVYDQNGGSAGVDFAGNDPSIADPDPRSNTYHPEFGGNGTGPLAGGICPILEMRGLSASEHWKAGEYRSSRNIGGLYYYPMRKGTQNIRLSGGLAINAHAESGGAFSGWGIDPVPLDSMRGSYTGENVANPEVRSAILEAVLPMPNVVIPIPGSVTIHMQVADPLVNSFPGDWQITVNPAASEITMQIPGDTPVKYTNGQNTIAAPNATSGADPRSNWWPPQVPTQSKSQRFPSVGYLQFLRTGIMPDFAQDSLPLRQQSGTPYRSLNFAPSTNASQRTKGGQSYPDWALLDLFHVPSSFQPVGIPLPNPLHLTWGGATAGLVNVNTVSQPFSSVTHRAALEAVMKDIQISKTYLATGEPQLTTVDEAALAAAVANYLTTLGRPLMTPGEICNVPEFADLLYVGVDPASISRNDLVRQIVGNLTTRSNTFSIYAIGQAIKKAPKNTQYGVFEAGDTIEGEVRKQILVERLLSPGVDDIPGNSQNPGADGVVGTADDPIDANYHPSMTYPLPYQFRILNVRDMAQ